MSRPRLLDLFCGAGGAGSSGAPYLPSNNVAYCLPIDVELTRKRTNRLSAKATLPHRNNLFRCELGRRIPLSGVMRCHATRFLPHVGKVVFNRANAKMCWVNAWRVIAQMHDDRAVHYWPVVKFPAHAMSFEVFAKASHLAVSSWSSRGFPLPAFIDAAAIDLAPKLFFDRFGVSHD